MSCSNADQLNPGMQEDMEERRESPGPSAHPRALYGISEKTTSGLFPLPSKFNSPHPHLGFPVSAASWIMRKLAFGIAAALARVAEKVSKITEKTKKQKKEPYWKSSN